MSSRSLTASYKVSRLTLSSLPFLGDPLPLAPPRCCSWCPEAEAFKPFLPLLVGLPSLMADNYDELYDPEIPRLSLLLSLLYLLLPYDFLGDISLDSLDYIVFSLLDLDFLFLSLWLSSWSLYSSSSIGGDLLDPPPSFRLLLEVLLVLFLASGGAAISSLDASEDFNASLPVLLLLFYFVDFDELFAAALGGGFRCSSSCSCSSSSTIFILVSPISSNKSSFESS